jgi:hypothetical protein
LLWPAQSMSFPRAAIERRRDRASLAQLIVFDLSCGTGAFLFGQL